MQDEFWHPFREKPKPSSPVSYHTPSAAEMKDHQQRREAMLQETQHHLRILPKPHNLRNIHKVLLDRELRGGAHLSCLKTPPKIAPTPKQGDRSPSTVLESPPQQPNPRHSIQYPVSVAKELRSFGEYCTSTKFHSSFLNHLGGDDVLEPDGSRPASSKAISTISVSFSCNGQCMASTHGDHTVKVTCCSTGRLLASLEGHPRTPWTVKFHPTNPYILASGCLGHQVRVWNWKTKVQLQMTRLESAIISLSFHPSGKVLAIANGTRLHFWGVDDAHTRRQDKLHETDQRHMLRCVHFPPSGDALIIGGVNPLPDDPRRRRSNTGMSFYLRWWDFDLEKAMETQSESNSPNVSLARRSISNPRTFVPRALLYNDGGFDVSPDGKRLCVCAEYWLPDGVDDAMELMRKEELAYQKELQEKAQAKEEMASSSEENATVAAALIKLKGSSSTNKASHGRSSSFRDGMEQAAIAAAAAQPLTPGSSSPESHALSAPTIPPSGFVPRTPPVMNEPRMRNLSPPPPPGRRATGSGFMRHTTVNTSGGQQMPQQDSDNHGVPVGSRGVSTPPPPPPAPGFTGSSRPPHPLSVISIPASASPNTATETYAGRGRYVPHVVVISLDTTPVAEELRDPMVARGKPPGAVARGYRPRLGQLLEAHPLEANKATAVTCVKFSPSTDFCLIGYGVREPVVEGGGNYHPVTAIYRIRGGMTHISTMLSGDDDVNIARFHPDSGHSFVYGTKQGRVRVLSPRPWNYYY